MTSAAGLLRITWDAAWGSRPAPSTAGWPGASDTSWPYPGADGKAITKRHRHLTVVADLGQSRILYLAEDRKQESLDGFWTTLTPEQLAGIQAVAMDVREPYVQCNHAHLPEAGAQIVFVKVPCGQACP